ncbi:MAG: CRISPR-associated endonuclease Cas1 [Gemmatimonadaceae bacterium]|nr:CRISPR-associated endonuclease Cas1 [Gemmatimonadaceae bacterium]
MTDTIDTITDVAPHDSPERVSSELLPVRMVNEFVYCPRLFHFMHVDGRWDDNAYTLEGKDAHRRVDRREEMLPDPSPGKGGVVDGDGDDPPTIARSVSLSSPTLGITAKLDLVEAGGGVAVPIDMKRGRVPANAERSWEPERVQLMAQGLLLREHGYACTEGVLYFAASRTRVPVAFTAELEAQTRAYIAQAREAMTSRVLPPPLEDSPKCIGCSLSGICLPDETRAMRARRESAAAVAEGDEELRRLYPPRDAALPFYVQEQGARVGKRGERLIVTKGEEEVGAARLKDVSQVVLMGNVAISAQTVHMLCDAGVPVVHVSLGHWFYGVTSGITLRNAFDRAAQYQAAGDPERALQFARAVVCGKGANQRTLLGRNVRPRPVPVLREMAMLLRKARQATSAEALLGLEGGIAARYFATFGQVLKPRDFDASWDFSSRNRRPPRDPVNALLSFGYALLAKECTVALLAEGLDPWWGLYHQPRHGRPALALDLMEELRPLIVDSAVMTAINTGMVTASSFERTTAACMLTAQGRKAFIRAYEARLEQLVTHPLFGYRCSWRSVVRVQARLLSRWLRGDVPEYIPVTTR